MDYLAILLLLGQVSPVSRTALRSLAFSDYALLGVTTHSPTTGPRGQEQEAQPERLYGVLSLTDLSFSAQLLSAQPTQLIPALYFSQFFLLHPHCCQLLSARRGRAAEETAEQWKFSESVLSPSNLRIAFKEKQEEGK